MEISVTDPLDQAFKKTRAVLFEPFDASKWFGLGFCAFLANLAAGGGGGGNVNPNALNGMNSRTGSPSGSGPNFPNISNPINQATSWLNENLVIVLVIAAISFVLIVGFVALLTWLGSRGQFMFIDGVATNSGAVKAPWHNYAREGNSLFKFKFIYAMLSMLLFLLLVAICVGIAWGDISAKTFGGAAIMSLVVFGLFFFMFLLIAVFIEFVISHFVIPTMYKRRIGVGEAFGVFRGTFMHHKGTLGLYFLLLIAIGFGTAIVATIVTLCLCCIPAIPYIGTVILLPIFVFTKTYNLYFLEQFGPEWKFFVDALEVEPDEPQQFNA